MPASIVLAAIGVQLTGVALAAATFAINFAASYVITRIFGQQSPSTQDNGVRQQVPPSSTNSIPVVYGDAWLGGTFVDAVMSTDQQTMYYVLAISNVSANGQFTYDRTKFYYGDGLITFDGTDPTKVVSLTDGDGNVDTKISGNLYINLYTSTAAGAITNVTGTAPSTFMGGADIPAALRWTGTRQMNGLAFAIVKLIYNRDAGTASLQPVTFKVKHALNGTGVAKPGDVLYDYLTAATYGGAVPASQVNSTACAALNTYSDATIPYTPSGGGSATQARYRINGILDTGNTVLENVDKILTSCDSWLGYEAATGQWAPIINKAESTSFNFDDSNIIGDIKVSVVDLASSINQIEVSFPFKENKDQPDYVFLQTPAGLLYPNEPVNKYSTNFDLVNDSVQATYLANRILEQAREDLIVSFSTAYTGIQVNAGDVVSITNADYGWSAKLFRVTKVQEASLPDGNLGARIECSEYNAAVYDDLSINQFSPAPNSGLTSAFYFPALSAPTFGDQAPTASPPTFSVTCQLPSSSRITTVSLYYTTVASPTQADWKIWATQTASYGEAYPSSLALKFPNVIVGSGTYYFAFTVGNELATSDLSVVSSSFNWATAIAGAFISTFSPATNNVSRTSGTPTFTGLVTRLYGSAFGSAIDFVTSQNDSDASFVNNTWRIGGSPTTGNSDITTTGGLVMGSISDGGSYAEWGIPTSMTSSPAILTVPVRYKNAVGVVTQAAASSIQFTFVDNGVNGTRTAVLDLYQWASSVPTLFPSGTSTYTWATGQFTAPGTLNGWSLTPDSPSPGQTLYIARQIYADTLTTATSSVGWSTSTAIVITQAGTNGQRTGFLELYQWSASAPTSYPSGTSTYTWATGEFTAPATLNGWSLTPGAAVVGQTLWGISIIVTDSLTTATSTATWNSTSPYPVGAAGTNGTNGIRTSQIELYQWASSAPTLFPSGDSTYTWATGAFTNPATLNSWVQTPGVGSPGQTLYGCKQTYSDSNTTATSTITWTTSTTYVVGYAGTNGANGTQSANPTVYQWALSIPGGPTGTSTYTWSSNTFTPNTIGSWNPTPGSSPSLGYTLWAASVNVVASATATTTVFNWSSASIVAIGYAGDNGTNGASSRICYVKTDRTSLDATPTTITTSGSTSFPSAGSWGATISSVNQTWQATPPSIVAGESVYQSDGVYNPATGNTVWNVPYLSTLKVGSLSAITVNTGALTVQDALTINTAGHIKGGQTAYNTGTGFFLGYSGAAYKFSIGSSTQSLTWDGTSLNIDGKLNCTASYQSGLFYTIAKFTDPGGAFASDINVWSINTKSTGIAVAGYATYSGVIGSTSTYRGVEGITTGGTSTSGVYGNGGSGIGVKATSGHIGVEANATGTGTALYVAGPMQITSTSVVTNLNADKLDGKDASAFVEIASTTTNAKYLYYVNNNTAPTDPNNRAAWIRVSTNDGAVVYFPGYL